MLSFLLQKQKYANGMAEQEFNETQLKRQFFKAARLNKPDVFEQTMERMPSITHGY